MSNFGVLVKFRFLKFAWEFCKHSVNPVLQDMKKTNKVSEKLDRNSGTFDRSLKKL